MKTNPSLKSKAATLTGTALLAICFMTLTPSPASAGWNPIKQVTNAGKRLENSVRKEAGNATGAVRKEAGNAASAIKRAHRLNYRVVIKNDPNLSRLNRVIYRFEGKPAYVNGGYLITHTGTSVNQPQISFDNGRGQTIQYSLVPGGVYYFGRRNGVLDIFRSN